MFTGKHYFTHQNKVLNTAEEQLKGECNAIMIIHLLIYYMAVMNDWLPTVKNYKRWCRGDKQNGATRSVIALAISQMI